MSREAGAIAVSREEVQHLSLLRVRAFPRWLQSVHGLQEDTVPARYLSSSASARGAACQLRPATPSKRRVSRNAGAIAVPWEEVQHLSLLRVRAFLRWL